MAQIYENYWKLTLEYSDINSDKFIGTLKIIIDFIDSEKKDYEELQNLVFSRYPKKDKASTRKSINQFVKLGFIKDLTSYNNESIDFLNAKTNRKRKSIFSQIVYKYSDFNASITQQQKINQVNFLIKTLEEVGKLSKEDLIGLMLVDIQNLKKGYLTKSEVEYYRNEAVKIGFVKRKYNQISYLTNLLKKLDDIVFIKNVLYFEDDAKMILLPKQINKRDNYLHRIYKNLLKEEVENKLNDVKCMIEKLSYPSLVASHIKPFINSNEDEAYDPDNGFLLSRNFDILFDKGYITFDNLGNIICCDELKDDVKNYIKNYKLDFIFLNEKRLNYLKYHQKHIFRGKSEN